LPIAFEFKDDKGKRFGVYLRAGGRCFIELFQGEVTGAAPKPSFQHICLEVDDIEKTVAEMKAKGIEVGQTKLGLRPKLPGLAQGPRRQRHRTPRVHAQELAGAVPVLTEKRRGTVAATLQVALEARLSQRSRCPRASVSPR